MTLKINGRPVHCPDCGFTLSGWRREVLPDTQDRDRVLFTVECRCGLARTLEDLLVELRPPERGRRR